MKPLLWMRALRRLKGRTPTRLSVLDSLALRLDSQGAGFASTRQLADDSGASQRTVVTALGWARRQEYLLQLQRGHRLGDGRTMASRWQLTSPSQDAPVAPWDQSQSAKSASQSAAREAPEVYNPEILPPPSYVSTGSAPAAAQNGGREPHENEPNARAALGRIRVERRLPFTESDLLDLAYEIGDDPYYDGYIAINAATEQSFNGARDIRKVLRTRLGLKP